MRTTVLYGAMTIGLASAFMYTVCAANSSPLNLKPVPQAAIDETQIPAPDDSASADAASAADACCSAAQAIGVGATKEQVVAAFGEPESFNVDSDRWTYDSHVVMFNDDGVSGWVRRDPTALLKQSIADFAGNFIYDKPAAHAAGPDPSDLLAQRNWPSVTKHTSKRGRASGPVFQKADWLRDWAQKCEQNRHRQPNVRYRIRYNNANR